LSAASSRLPVEKLDAAKMEHPTRTPRDALAASQAPALHYRLSRQGVPANIYVDGAVVRTNAALHAALRLGHHFARYQRLAPRPVARKKPCQ
jgi:hypothetical protein